MTIKIQKNREQFTKIIGVLKNLNLDILLDIKQDGINIKAVDFSNAALLKIKLKPALFEIYNIEKDQQIALNLDQFHKLLSKFCNYIELIIGEDNIILQNDKNKFELRYIIFDGNKNDIPDLQYENIYKIKSDNFFGELFSLFDISEFIKISGEDKLKVSIAEKTIKGEVLIDAEKEKSNNKSANYNIGFFNKISDLKSIFEDIYFKFDDSIACTVSGDNDIAEFKYIIAPAAD